MKRLNALLKVIFIFQLFILNASSQEKSIKAFETDTPPRIDGLVSDECWKKAPAADGFVNLRTKRSIAKQTTVFIAFDSVNLYFLFRCAEPAILDLVVKDENKFNWYDDHVEIFIRPFINNNKYLQIAVNTAGKVYSSIVTGSRNDQKTTVKRDETWRPDIKTAARVEVNHFIIEISIPIKALQLDSEQITSDWGINFCRDIIKPEHSYNVWSSLIKDGYAEPENFGLLPDIGSKIQTARVLSVIEFNHGFLSASETSSKASCLAKNLSSKTVNVFSAFSIYDPNGKQLVRTKKQVRLGKNAETKIEVPYEIPDGVNRIVCRLDIDDQETGDWLWSSGDVAVVLPPELVIHLENPHYKNLIFEKYPPAAISGYIALNMRKENMQNKAVVSFSDPTGRVLSTSEYIADNKIPFTIDMKKLKTFGRYGLTVTFKKRDGSVLKDERTIRYLKHQKGESFIDKQGFIIVDGKRFFPLGCYSLTRPFDMGWITDKENWGFNTYMCSGLAGGKAHDSIRRDEKYAKGGLKWIPNIDAFYTSVFEAKWDKLRADLSNTDLKNPDLIGWTIADEPIGRGTPLSNIQEAYRIISEIDPYHIITLVDNSPDKWALMFGCTDAATLNSYPIFARQPLTEIYMGLTETYKLNSTKPICIISAPEGNSWKGAPDVNRYEYFETTAFLALVGRARGITWFTAGYSTEQQFQWIRSISSNLIAPLIPVLLTDDYFTQVQIDNEDIYFLIKKIENAYIIISVNGVDKEYKNVNITLPRNWQVVSINDFYTGVKTADPKNTFNISYKGYEPKVIKVQVK